MPRSALLAGSACALLLSCLPTGMCACPPSRTHAVAYGTVKTAAGAPAAGARVQATVYHAVCGQGFAETDPAGNPVTSTAAGDYRLHFYSMSGPRTACVRVTARGAGAADSVFADFAVALREDRAASDSVRVDLVLP